jgi:hypothetical protein
LNFPFISNSLVVMEGQRGEVQRFPLAFYLKLLWYIHHANYPIPSYPIHAIQTTHKIPPYIQQPLHINPQNFPHLVQTTTSTHLILLF